MGCIDKSVIREPAAVMDNSEILTEFQDRETEYQTNQALLSAEMAQLKKASYRIAVTKCMLSKNFLEHSKEEQQRDNSAIEINVETEAQTTKDLRNELLKDFSQSQLGELDTEIKGQLCLPKCKVPNCRACERFRIMMEEESAKNSDEEEAP